LSVASFSSFIFSNNYEDLNKKLKDYYSEKIEINTDQKFYVLGAKERIFKYINEILWNS
jgi:hypothetical protein